MPQVDRTRVRKAAVDRRADRLVAMTAIILAVGFLALAILSTLLPAADRVGLWLPIHLALAGAASTAIAGMMPFFSAAIATSQPVDARARWASLGGVAAGASSVTLGFATGALAMAALGGVVFSGGMLLVGYATLMPLRRGLGPRGGVVATGYGAALAMVLAGALLATLFLAGWPPVLEAWGYLKPAHAWLNVIGFVSLIIATTLLHLFPTVVGARILRVPSAYLTPLGLAAGAVLVATGFALRADVLARFGALLVAIGALALAIYAGQVWRSRARWSGDRDWHRFAMGGSVSAIVWFEVGIALAVVRLLAQGAQPAAVSIDVLAAPLIVGWMGLMVLASATHLVPAIGPGDPHEHARQRRHLGRLARPRLVAANIGVAALTYGLAFSVDAIVAVALLLLAATLGVTAVLLAGAAISGVRNARAASS